MIFLELVPRDLDTLVNQSQRYLADFTQLTGINIPDVKRLDIRSSQAAHALLTKNITAIPHIRTQDADIASHLETLQSLYNSGLRSVLFIYGDVVEKSAQVGTKPPELIKACKERFPDMQVYAGIDPYRQSFDDEIDYAQEKLTAGADGLFSQPFFDPALLQTYLDTFKNTAFFCGISPVTSPKSKTYWENVNHVRFSADFECTIDYHIQLGKDLLSVAKANKQHAYLMPIRTPVRAYLEGLFI